MRLTKKTDTKERTTIGMPKAVACYWKLKKYEDIEDELGIDLIILVKCLKSKFCYIKGMNEKYYLMSAKRNIFKAFSPKYDVAFTLYFNDYGKTWALTKEELE